MKPAWTKIITRVQWTLSPRKRHALFKETVIHNSTKRAFGKKMQQFGVRRFCNGKVRAVLLLLFFHAGSRNQHSKVHGRVSSVCDCNRAISRGGKVALQKGCLCAVTLTRVCWVPSRTWKTDDARDRVKEKRIFTFGFVVMYLHTDLGKLGLRKLLRRWAEYMLRGVI